MEKCDFKNKLILLLFLSLYSVSSLSDTRIVTRSSAGGTLDTVIRTFSNYSKEKFIIENIPGAGGSIALKRVLNSRDDSLYAGQTNLYLKYYLDKKENKEVIDIKKSFDYFLHIANILNVIIVHPSIPANDIKSLIKLANSNKNKINVGTTGLGSTSDILFRLLGKNFYRIPYKSSTISHFDLYSGNIDVTSSTILLSLNNHKNGKVKIIGRLFEKKYPNLENIPYIKDFDVKTNIIILARKDYKNEIFRESILTAMKNKSLRNALFNKGIDVQELTIHEYNDLIYKQESQWKKIGLIDHISN